MILYFLKIPPQEPSQKAKKIYLSLDPGNSKKMIGWYFEGRSKRNPCFMRNIDINELINFYSKIKGCSEF